MFSNLELLKKILDTIEEGVLVSNTDGIIVAYNRQAITILGITEDYPLGKNLLHPNWRQVNVKGEPLSLEELPSSVTRSTGKVQKDFIVGLEMSEGNTRWLSVNTQTLNHDNIQYVFSTFIDITEKHNLQIEAKIAKERLKHALMGSEIGVWEYNTVNSEVYFSEEWKRITGYKPAEPQNAFQQWEVLIHPEDKENVLKSVNDCLNDLSPAFEVEYRLKEDDGGYKWISGLGKITARTEDGSPERFSGTIRNITERKKGEELLKASEQKFKKAFHNSAVGMAIVALEGKWIDVNPALCEMLGYSKAEFSDFTFIDITHPEDLAEDLNYVSRILSGEIETYTIEKRYFRKDGDVVWILLTVSVMVTENDGQKTAIAQMVDITQTKALITQLEAKNSQLNLATLDLKNKIEQLEEFNRIVAHNLRGPVGNILQLTDMLAEDQDSLELYISMLKEASTGLDSTLNELIKILEIKLNKEIDFQACSFDDIILKIQNMLNVQIQNKNVSFITDLQVRNLEYPTVYLESILYNLITNAIKYKRKAVKTLIQIKTFMKDDRVVLEVIDNGLGIDLQRYGHQIFKLNKIFHKGFDSKGLGLFILKNQIETLGGKISVISEPDKGSTFKVIF